MTLALFVGQVDKVDPTFFHQAALLLAGLLAGGLAATGIYANMTRRKREIYPQPLDVRTVPPGISPEACANLHQEIGRRLNSHDDQITQLWNLMRNEHAAIRTEMAHGFQSIDRSLGRIEGKLEEKK